MAAKIESKRSRISQSLVTSLATAFVALSVIPLLLVSGLLGYIDFRDQRQGLSYQQQLIASEAATQVSGFIERIFSVLETSAQVGQVSNQEQQRLILEKLLGLEDAVREVVWVDKTGQKIVEASRRSLAVSSNLVEREKSEALAQVSQGQRFISTVAIDDLTGEPLVILAVPVKDVFGDFQGALLAEVNLKFMWEVVDQLQVGQTGTAYVVDRQGNLIAFEDAARVLETQNLSHLAEVAEFINDVTTNERELYSIGINNSPVVAAYVPLGSPDWAVVTEIPVWEAYQGSFSNAALLLVIFLVIAAVAAGTGVYASRYLTTPLLNLTQTATRLAAGEIELQAALEGPAEVVRLATAFNSMTTRLQELIGSLEQRVAARTRRLEIVANLGERLLSILNPEELLNEVVNQIKDNFGYYHSHIYLLDTHGENLVVAAGTGEAGAEMKARRHSIALDAPTSLVARAARSGETVKVDNVREAKDWLPNPLLPHTYSEMAVPIILDERVIGVLDVQENKIAGLDEGDASLLRSLVSLIAVTMRNARLFDEVETALNEAYAAQERYVEQSWEKSKVVARGGQYHYAPTEAPPLAEVTLAKTRQQALEQNQLMIVALDNNAPVEPPNAVTEKTPGEGKKPEAIVAPIVLHNRTIGDLQLYRAEADPAWTEDDIAITEAVISQLVQTAENLRLFEETRERAGREQMIREITEKMRAATTVEELVKTTTRELGQRFSVEYAMIELGLKTPSSQQPEEGNGHAK